MPDVEKTIGAGLDYSTIGGFEAARTNAVFASANTTAIGRCNAETFDDDVTFSGAESNIVFTHLTAEVAERHGGLEGVGARLVNGGTGARISMVDTMRISWIEFDGNGSTCQLYTNDATFTTPLYAEHLILHGERKNQTAIDAIVRANGRDLLFIRNIVYDCINTAGGSGNYDGVILDCDLSHGGCINNTVDNIGKTGGTSGDVSCIKNTTNDTDSRIYNNYAGRVSGGTGTNACFAWPASTTNVNAGNNASTDTTANVGTGNLTSLTAADQFVSLTGGSENYHLKSGADLIDAGSDRGTTPTNVNIDVDERDVDAQADTWDIGADEFVAAAGGATPKGVFGGRVLGGPFSGPFG